TARPGAWNPGAFGAGRSVHERPDPARRHRDESVDGAVSAGQAGMVRGGEASADRPRAARAGRLQPIASIPPLSRRVAGLRNPARLPATDRPRAAIARGRARAACLTGALA